MHDWDDDEPPPPSPEARRRVELVFVAIFAVGVVAVFGVAWGARLPGASAEENAGVRTEGGFLVEKSGDAERALREPPGFALGPGRPVGPGSPGDDVRVSELGPGDLAFDPGPSESAPGRVVERAPTPVTELELAEIAMSGHQRIFGRRATLARVGVAWAHLSLEHLKGEAVECNNFGNLSVPEGTRHAHYTRRLSERTRKNAKAALGDWREVEMRFRAFPSKEAGIDAYWRLLDQRYKGALAMYDIGNAHHAGRKLGEAGYATAYPQPYALSMGELHGEFRARVLPALRAKHPDYEAASLEEAGITP